MSGSKFRISMLGLVLAAASLAEVFGALGQDGTQQDQKMQVLTSWLRTALESTPTKVLPQKIVPIVDDTIKNVFPEGYFYGIYFSTWPVAPRLPQSLSYEMIAIVRGEVVETLRSIEDLKRFLMQRIPAVQEEGQARVVVLASLRLAEAVAKAGAYRFGEPDASFDRQNGYIVAAASAAVQEPGRGEVTVRMKFGLTGEIVPDAIEIDDRTRRGPPSRP